MLTVDFIQQPPRGVHFSSGLSASSPYPGPDLDNDVHAQAQVWRASVSLDNLLLNDGNLLLFNDAIGATWAAF